MALPQHQKPVEFGEYVNATSIASATRALADGAGTPVAGGTDLWLQKELGAKLFGPRLVNIRQVRELGGIVERDGRIRIGALATVTEILESALLMRLAPVLPQTADRFASAQIRNAATVGGNIANASPAADLALPLLCLDAEVELASWRREQVERRMVPLRQFFTGPGRTRRAPDELISAVWLDRPAADFDAAFHKSGPRPALEISRVALCFGGRRQGRRLSAVRVACGAVSPTPVRCRATEAAIEGAAIDKAAIVRALEVLHGEIAPIDDVRGSTWYRRHLASAYLEQELRRVAQG